jgi:cytochrome c-type biogenesis protein CcmF
MNQIGYTALLLALVVSAYGVVAPLVGARTGRAVFLKSGERAVYAFCGLAVIASFALLYLLLSRDFSNQYVYEYTSRELSVVYTLSAFWAGNAGSLLLWVLILGILSSVAVYQQREKSRELIPYVISILMAIGFFFCFLMLASGGSHPFTQLSGAVPANGYGLNPILINPGMIIHPVSLYIGYVGFSIPFAFAMAALITKRLGDTWIRSTRRWTLFAWLFLTAGNIIGAWWAYVTLGWGGYWAWDPVENASFMPWLTGTAFLHSVMIQEKKDMLKVWNMFLIILTFILTIFGTFLTRSGVVSSVHGFGLTALGPFFIVFMGIILVFSLGLLVSRYDLLKSRNQLDSFLSRESTFLLNNLILAMMTFIVLGGVLLPVITEALSGNKITVGPEFFDKVMAPIGLVLMFLVGVCPLIAWRRASLSNLRKNFLIPAIVGVVVLVVLLALGMRHGYALVSFALAGFVITAIVLEFGKGLKVRRDMTRENPVVAFGKMVWNNKRRYGGYTVHLGVILLLVGITGSYGFKQELDQQRLTKGQSLTIGKYELTYTGFSTYDTNEKTVGTATFEIKEGGKVIGSVSPVREFYFNKDQPWTRVDRDSNLIRDVYVSLLQYSDNGAEVLIKVDINPLVSWLWVGGFVMALGALIAIWPSRAEKRRQAARYEVQARLHEV